MKKCRGFVILFFMVIAIAVVSCGGGGGGSPSGTSGGSNTATNNPSSVPTAPAGFVTVVGSTVTGGDKFKVGSYTGCFVAGRTVTISTFFMSDHEVTQAEFEAVMGTTNPSYFDGTSGKEAASGETQANRPVERVSWYDAIAFCNKKSIADGLTPCYAVSGITNWATLSYNDIPTTSNTNWNNATCNFTANGYRLPTEVEWEYATLGGAAGVSAEDPTDYAGTNDSASLGSYAWYDDWNSDIKTHEVKKKSPNALNLYDMSGNVCEWCWDWDGTISSLTPAAGAPSGVNRVFRGSSCVLNAVCCSAAYRNRSVPYFRTNGLGFRVCRTAQ